MEWVKCPPNHVLLPVKKVSQCQKRGRGVILMLKPYLNTSIASNTNSFQLNIMSSSEVARQTNQVEDSTSAATLRWRGTVKDMASTYVALREGCSEIGHELTVRGVVSEIVKNASNFRMYVLKDSRGQETLRVICREGDYVPVDDMTFEEMHEDVQVGDTVNVLGYPHRSQANNLCLYSNFIYVTKYGDNEYEQEVPTDEEEFVSSEDDTYEDDDESFADDSELDDEEFDRIVNEEDETDEESDHDGRASPVDIESHSEHTMSSVPFDASDPSYVLERIPMCIYENHLIYNGVTLEILSVLLNEPFKLVIITERSLTFTITKLGDQLVGVVVPPNSIERNCENGYDCIHNGSFESIVRILQ
jgi:hypothetical protein